MPDLFSSLTMRDVTLRNRIGVSPMCQYSSEDGFATDWHLVHLGSRAVGGAGLVFTEATAVSPEGRISPADLGIWNDAHIPMLARIAAFVSGQGAVPGIQLAHAGRKASTAPPWDGRAAVSDADGGWEPVAPSPVAFNADYRLPLELDQDGIEKVIGDFVIAAKRSVRAGFQVVELHAAHGYLLHSFLSPLSNRRSDVYGGAFENRIRLLLEVTAAVRDAVPDGIVLAVRLSTTDWIEGGWTVDDSVRLTPLLLAAGADLIDCSSGGLSPAQNIPVGANYQVPAAARIRSASGGGAAVAAVGMITEPMQADAIIRTGQADLVLMARELLRSPYWPLHAAPAVHREGDVPRQYKRAF